MLRSVPESYLKLKLVAETERLMKQVRPRRKSYPEPVESRFRLKYETNA